MIGPVTEQQYSSPLGVLPSVVKHSVTRRLEFKDHLSLRRLKGSLKKSNDGAMMLRNLESWEIDVRALNHESTTITLPSEVPETKWLIKHRGKQFHLSNRCSKVPSVSKDANANSYIIELPIGTPSVAVNGDSLFMYFSNEFCIFTLHTDNLFFLPDLRIRFVDVTMINVDKGVVIFTNERTVAKGKYFYGLLPNGYPKTRRRKEKKTNIQEQVPDIKDEQILEPKAPSPVSRTVAQDPKENKNEMHFELEQWFIQEGKKRIQKRDPNFIQRLFKKNYYSEFQRRFEKPRKVLGQGGFGIVFWVAQEIRQTIESFAVKRIAVDGSVHQLSKALEEVKNHIVLKHDGIVKFYDAWIEIPPKGWQRKADAEMFSELSELWSPVNRSDYSKYLYIQIELCRHSLAEWLKSNLSRDYNRAKLWFRQIVSAVAYIHRMGKIHRDLKPSNILIDFEDNLKICDLGLATSREMRDGIEFSRTRTYCGTQMYKAPEQLFGIQPYSSKVDIYSLGLIFIELSVWMTTEEKEQTFLRFQSGNPPSAFLNGNKEAKSFVSWLTNYDSAKRPTCEQILQQIGHAN